ERVDDLLRQAGGDELREERHRRRQPLGLVLFIEAGELAAVRVLGAIGAAAVDLAVDLAGLLDEVLTLRRGRRGRGRRRGLGGGDGREGDEDDRGEKEAHALLFLRHLAPGYSIFAQRTALTTLRACCQAARDQRDATARAPRPAAQTVTVFRAVVAQ